MWLWFGGNVEDEKWYHEGHVGRHPTNRLQMNRLAPTATKGKEGCNHYKVLEAFRLLTLILVNRNSYRNTSNSLLHLKAYWAYLI